MDVRCIEREANCAWREEVEEVQQTTVNLFLQKNIGRNFGTDSVKWHYSGHTDKWLKEFSIFSLELTIDESITFNSLSSATLLRPPAASRNSIFTSFRCRNSPGQWLNECTVILFSIEINGNAMSPHLCKLFAPDACKSNCLNNG